MDEYGTNAPTNKKKRNGREEDVFDGNQLWNADQFQDGNASGLKTPPITLGYSGEWTAGMVNTGVPLTFSNEFWIQNQERLGLSLSGGDGSMKIDDNQNSQGLQQMGNPMFNNQYNAPLLFNQFGQPINPTSLFTQFNINPQQTLQQQQLYNQFGQPVTFTPNQFNPQQFQIPNGNPNQMQQSNNNNLFNNNHSNFILQQQQQQQNSNNNNNIGNVSLTYPFNPITPTNNTNNNSNLFNNNNNNGNSPFINSPQSPQTPQTPQSPFVLSVCNTVSSSTTTTTTTSAQLGISMDVDNKINNLFKSAENNMQSIILFNQKIQQHKVCPSLPLLPFSFYSFLFLLDSYF
jgi:hypothetical protein